MSGEVGVFGPYAGPLVRVMSWTGGRSFYRLRMHGAEVRVYDRPPAHGGRWEVGRCRPGTPDDAEVERVGLSYAADPTPELRRVEAEIRASNAQARRLRTWRRLQRAERRAA